MRSTLRVHFSATRSAGRRCSCAWSSPRRAATDAAPSTRRRAMAAPACSSRVPAARKVRRAGIERSSCARTPARQCSPTALRPGRRRAHTRVADTAAAGAAPTTVAQRAAQPARDRAPIARPQTMRQVVHAESRCADAAAATRQPRRPDAHRLLGARGRPALGSLARLKGKLRTPARSRTAAERLRVKSARPACQETHMTTCLTLPPPAALPRSPASRCSRRGLPAQGSASEQAAAADATPATAAPAATLHRHLPRAAGRSSGRRAARLRLGVRRTASRS